MKFGGPAGPSFPSPVDLATRVSLSSESLYTRLMEESGEQDRIQPDPCRHAASSRRGLPASRSIAAADYGQSCSKKGTRSTTDWSPRCSVTGRCSLALDRSEDGDREWVPQHPRPTDSGSHLAGRNINDRILRPWMDHHPSSREIFETLFAEAEKIIFRKIFIDIRFV